MPVFLGWKQIRKTRKDHRCDWCGETIEVGSSCTLFTWADEGCAESAYWHPECEKAARTYTDFDPHWEDYRSFVHLRGEDHVDYLERTTGVCQS